MHVPQSTGQLPAQFIPYTEVKLVIVPLVGQVTVSVPPPDACPETVVYVPEEELEDELDDEIYGDTKTFLE